MMLRRVTLRLAMSAALSGCGGGGSAGSGLPYTPPSAVLASGSSSVTISIGIPAASSKGAALGRQPLYVSTHTQSASIAVNGQTPIVANLSASSPNCVAVAGGGRTCTVNVNAPVGVDTFAETLYATVDATGAVLSQGKTSATIVAEKANTVLLTLDGVIASLALTLADPTPPEGVPAQIGLTVNFNDASGASIIGSDPFVTPVTLSDSDGSGITSLSKTTLNSPADASGLVVNYSGAVLAQAVIGASAGSIVAPNVTLRPQAAAPGGFNDYTTFGYDDQRDLFNPNSTAITPASVPALHLAWQSSLNDYNTQTQPILATEIPGHSGVLFVGGGSGNVYAYDALSGALIWTTSTGQEAISTCGSGTTYWGTGGTAAYDPASKSLYVVGNSNPAVDAYPSNWLFHLDGATGKNLGQVNLAPAPAGAGESNFAHTSVTLRNGIAYVGTGSTCDVSSWRGRVVAASVPSMTLANTFFTLWDPGNVRGAGAQPWSGGSIWGWGGVSLDLSGNVLTGVGNADTGSSHGHIQAPFVAAPLEYSGYAETLLEISPDLSTALASNHPISPSVYGGVSVDLDVQGTPLVFQPAGIGCQPIVALQDKAGTLSIYNESALSSGPIAQYTMAPSSWSDSYLGGPAYSSATGLLYADVASSTSPSLFPPGLIAINPGCGAPSVAWHAAFGPDSTAASIPRSVPAVSAGGVVFAGTVDNSGSGGSLWAINASTGAVLNGGAPVFQTSGNLRMAPTIDGDWLFVLDNNGNIYGLTIDPNYKAIAAKRRAPNARQRMKWISAAHS